MAGFNLSNLTDRITQAITENVNFSSAFGKNEKAIMDLFASLSNGETILGKVLSSSEESFQISTGNNVIINAKAEGGVLLTEGTSVLFEVNKFSEGKVSLRPLCQNMSSEETAKSALRQAGIAVNERSLEMTVRNMEYGNPIDRNSLLASYKDVLQYEESPVKYIIDLQKMDIPVTSDNLTQYEAYMNMKNMIADSFMDISESLLNETLEKAESSLGSNSQIVSVSDLISNQSLMDLKGMLDSVIRYSEELTNTSNQGTQLHEFDVVKLANELKSFGFNTQSTDKLIYDNQVTSVGEHAFNSKEVINSIFKDINDTVDRHISDIFNQKNVIVKPQYQQLFGSSELKNALYKAFASDWSLGDNEAPSNNNVSELYKKLYSATKELADNLSLHLKNDSQTVQLANNIQNNIDFMEQLNKYIPYVQLPVGNNPNNKAELYVYRNRKNFTGEDKELSAYLHLDMEHLGRTDVMIKMLNGNVSTNFKLSSDEALSLVEQNIEFLNRRLTEKGYSVKVETELLTKAASPIQEMLMNNEGHLVIAKTSFDARI